MPQASETSAAPVKVLVVDDDESGRYLVASILQPSGYHVTFAEDGSDALEQVARETPDLIITDVLMPRMDGYRLCVKLRSEAATKDVPIVACTASFSQPADTRFADSLGVDDFLVKPYEPEVLLAEVRRLAGGSSSPHEALEPGSAAIRSRATSSAVRCPRSRSMDSSRTRACRTAIGVTCRAAH